MKEELDNLILEIASMLESGTITVGALGLSQNSVDYILGYEKGEEYKKGYNQCLKDEGLTGEEHQGKYL